MGEQQTGIRSIGLEQHLNQTKDNHNNQGYDDFVRYKNSAVPNAAIARIFGVSRLTMSKWMTIYKEETGDD